VICWRDINRVFEEDPVAVRVSVAIFVLTTAFMAPVQRQFDTWKSYGGGVDSSQYSSLKQIDKSNVTQLTVAWTFPTNSGVITNPLIVDNVMFVPRGAQGGGGRGGRGARGAATPATPPAEPAPPPTPQQQAGIVALDAATGKELWFSPGNTTARGMNYWESADRSDRRLIIINGGYIKELNARTGETIATFGDAGRVDPSAESDRQVGRPSNNPGRVYKDTIIVSLPASGANYDSTPGDVRAFDVRTGKLKWTFHSVPTAGEFGADTWPAEALKAGQGGVHNWSELTVDEDKGIVFVPFGSPRFDFYGGNRKGNNLFGNSLVALDANTGKRLWHYQMVHHDLWDYDLPNAPKLLTVRNNGRTVDVVAQVTKHGFLFVLNRETGVPLWPVEERPVPQSDVPGEYTSPTQPFPTLPEPFARQSFTEKDINPFMTPQQQEQVRQRLKDSRNEGLFTPPSMRGSIQLPGHNGGANWGSAAVDPVRGYFYVFSKELPTALRIAAPAAAGGRGGGGGGAATAGATPRAWRPEGWVEYSSPYEFMNNGQSPAGARGMPVIGPPWSQMTAYDLNTGKKLWQVPNGSVTALGDAGKDIGSAAPRGGVVVTAGGLVFSGTPGDRKFRAYDADNGKVLWEMDLPGAPEGVPAVYQVAGRQYIAVPTGAGSVFQVSGGNALPPAGPAQYVVFALPAK
jgi:glucose dehydrogenase